jgi:phosphatidylserine/phosphatidylglycerophosphate/cardiolipin synthase-like enzyme
MAAGRFRRGPPAPRFPRVMSTLKVLFLEDGGQTAEAVAQWLSSIVRAARVSIDLAIYDCHLEGKSADIFVGALHDRTRAGVALRIVYNEPKAVPPEGEVVDPGHPAETSAFFAQNQLPAFPVGDSQGGSRLMHQKYLLVDAGTKAARMWAGSANITMAAFTRQENNLLDICSPDLVQAYTANFEELWKTREIAGSGMGGGASAMVNHERKAATVEVRFAPGQGNAIDHEVAQRIRAARREVTVASVVLSSEHVLNALTEVAARGLPLSGIVDVTQMDDILARWRMTPASAWKASAFAALVSYGRLHGKRSSRAWPAGPHDYMHNKVLVVDDTVITGSYNFSVNAQSNAENILFIDSPSLALAYRAYIQRLLLRYPPV